MSFLVFSLMSLSGVEDEKHATNILWVQRVLVISWYVLMLGNTQWVLLDWRTKINYMHHGCKYPGYMHNGYMHHGYKHSGYMQHRWLHHMSHRRRGIQGILRLSTPRHLVIHNLSTLLNLWDCPQQVLKRQVPIFHTSTPVYWTQNCSNLFIKELQHV